MSALGLYSDKICHTGPESDESLAIAGKKVVRQGADIVMHLVIRFCIR